MLWAGIEFPIVEYRLYIRSMFIHLPYDQWPWPLLCLPCVSEDVRHCRCYPSIFFNRMGLILNCTLMSYYISTCVHIYFLTCHLCKLSIFIFTRIQVKISETTWPHWNFDLKMLILFYKMPSPFAWRWQTSYFNICGV